MEIKRNSRVSFFLDYDGLDTVGYHNSIGVVVKSGSHEGKEVFVIRVVAGEGRTVEKYRDEIAFLWDGTTKEVTFTELHDFLLVMHRHLQALKTPPIHEQ